MKVYFAGSNHNLDMHIEKYRKILAHIKSEHHVLTREWVESDLQRKMQEKPYSADDYRAIWKEVKTAILESDVAIFDISENSYSIGYQTAFALSHKKPVLALSDNARISHTIIIGEDNPLLTIEQYDTSSLLPVLQNFFMKFGSGKQDMRFNMLLDRETQMYLELESYKSGRTKAKIVRDLIKSSMDQGTGL